jgi:hypothetical protein
MYLLSYTCSEITVIKLMPLYSSRGAGHVVITGVVTLA